VRTIVVGVTVPVPRSLIAEGAVVSGSPDVDPESLLEIPELFGTSSAVFIAMKYVVFGESPVSVMLSDDPATCGVGSPVTCVAIDQFPSVMRLVL
jgi:hypothetical protein